MSSIEEKITANFDGIEVRKIEEGRIEVKTKKEALLSTLNFLKDEGYGHLGLVSCVDRIEEGIFELVYILSRYLVGGEVAVDQASLIVKTEVPRGNPTLVTSVKVFETAEPYERELHEMFGIVFSGHPRLTPLFLERDIDLPPMRKDFDTRKYVEEEFESIPPVED